MSNKHQQVINEGLQPLVLDSRDIQLGALVSLPKLHELPKQFTLGQVFIKDQLETDFCSAFATDGASELQEGVELSPEWGFAMSKKLSGNVSKWGQDLRTALARHTKYGALERQDAPFTIFTNTSDFLRDPKNWPVELEEKARKHCKKSYTFISGPYDHYDNIRATIWKFKDERRAVVFGVEWVWEVSEYVLKRKNKKGFGHAVYAIGWEDDGLIIVNSAGITAGRNGLHCISREVVNTYVEKYGAAAFMDYSKEELEYFLSNCIKIDQHWLSQIISALSAFIKDIFKKHG